MWPSPPWEFRRFCFIYYVIASTTYKLQYIILYVYIVCILYRRYQRTNR